MRDEFLLGPSLLLSPVTDPGATRREVYLPRDPALTARATIPLAWDEAKGTLTLGPRSGSFPGMLATRQLRDLPRPHSVLESCMSHALLDSARRLSDQDLLQWVSHLAARERDTIAQLIAHLAEMESRELHLKQGYGSLFEYCRVALRLSEHEAYNRCAAAHAARRFPLILGIPADGSINLTTIRLLASHLTPENHRRVLDAAQGKRKTEVEEIVAALAPRPDVPTTVRRMPALAPAAPAAAGVPDAAPTVSATAADALSLSAGERTPAPVVPLVTPMAAVRPQPVLTMPLAPDRYRLQLTISGETLEKLRLAADMLGHAVPNGDGAAVIDRALTTLLADLARRKFAATERPRSSKVRPEATSRYIPAEVKRAVWVRDLGRCAYAGTGRRCAERRCLEFHHVKPYAAGGPPTVENIQLRCRRHNQHEARAYFGRLERFGAGEVREAPATYGATTSPLTL